MIYLLLGEDPAARDRKVDEIKSKLIKSPEALQFDFEILHGFKLSPADLKKSLLGLPVLSTKRLIIIREVQKLNEHNKKLVLEFAESPSQHLDVILDATGTEGQEAFLQKLSGKVKTVQFQQTVKPNTFDMTNAIGSRDPQKALLILSELFSAGQHPLQIMGGVVWFWGKLKGRLPSENFEKGLFELQQADLNIKRSRLDPENALEVLVVKLANLVAY